MSSTLQSSCSSKHNLSDAIILCVIGWQLPTRIDELLRSPVYLRMESTKQSRELLYRTGPNGRLAD